MVSPSSPPSPSSPTLSISPYLSEDEILLCLSGSNLSFSEYDDDEDFILLDKPHSKFSSQNEPSAATVTTSEQPTVSAVPGEARAIPSLLRDEDVSLSTPNDRATPIPSQAPESSERRSEAAVTLPSIPSAREARNLERAARKKLKKLQKKKAKVVVASATPEDKERAKKERKRAARQRRKERKRLQKKQADPAAKPTPNKARTPVVTQTTPPELYQEASSFISSFLETPVAKRDSICRLTLLQSLIVELGLVSTGLPATLRAARTFVKAHVFVNIREYIAHRGHEQAAIQHLLHPSRSALIRDIKRKRNPASLKWVKKHGLEVLLVECFTH